MKIDSLTVVLPTLNESGNIEILIQNLFEKYAKVLNLEVIVIDDKSEDDTAQKVQDLGLPGVKMLVNDYRIGLAKSIKKGIEFSTNEHVLIMDSDLTHSVTEIGAMLKVAEVFELVSGSRFSQGGSMESKRHYIASLAYNWCLRAILRTQIQDNLGGFWLMRKRDVMSLPLDKIFYGYGDYFFRFLYFASASNFSMIEVPSAYASRKTGKSKSNFVKLFIKYSWEASRFQLSVKTNNIRASNKS